MQFTGFLLFFFLFFRCTSLESYILKLLLENVARYSNNATQSNIHLYFFFCVYFLFFFLLCIHHSHPFAHTLTHSVSLVTEEILNNFFSLSFYFASSLLPFVLYMWQPRSKEAILQKCIRCCWHAQILRIKIKNSNFSHGKINLNAQQLNAMYLKWIIFFIQKINFS